MRHFGDLLDVYLAVTSVAATPVLAAHEGLGLGEQALSRLEIGRPGMDDPLARTRTDWWTVEANLAGLAAMSVPIGTSDGLPVGLQLMSAPVTTLRSTGRGRRWLSTSA